MVILAMAAHPDDIEMSCAGTLVKYAKQGDKVFMGSLTNGNVGRPDTDLHEMERIRKAELEASAKLIGAEVIWMGVDDELTDVSVDLRLKMTDVFRYCKPDIVFTHASNDYHADHRNCSQLVIDAAPLACVPKIIRTLPFLEKQFEIYYMDNADGIQFTPVEYVDISDTIDQKRQMLQCHASQLSYTGMRGIDMVEKMETLARFRGMASKCRYAEGFVRFEAVHRGITYRILP